MKLYIVTIATLLSAVHAVDIRGFCNNKLVGNPPKLSMRCTYSKGGGYFRFARKEFDNFPDLPSVCDGDACFWTYKNDIRQMTVGLSGWLINDFDPTATMRLVDPTTNTQYYTASFSVTF